MQSFTILPALVADAKAFTSAGLLPKRVKEKASGRSRGARWPYFKELANG